MWKTCVSEQKKNCNTALDSARKCWTVLDSASKCGTTLDSASKRDIDTIRNINYYNEV